MAKKQIQSAEPMHKIVDVVFEEVMHNSMIPYSENVILDRAIPRVEDGLKPVQRRILFAMHEAGYTPDKPYKKCAAIVGDVLGKYHPHGDSSVYGALVYMAQPFSMRMPLIDGHGNFGSIDGDSAAAYRYTEARMNQYALELLRDLDKETVDWQPNFDDSLEEPNTLPGRFPNLLVNGAMGIAVGVATNIPTHNIGEVIDATVAMIDNPKITTAELLKIMPGPDFPTGGTIIPVDSMEDIYENGKGKIIIRSRYHLEEESNGKKNIVITEIPYSVIKAKMLVQIAELRDNNKDILGDITDVVDESDKQGTRAVIKCKKEADVDKIVQYLLKKTNLQTNYSINMVAIANGKPELLSLRAILTYYIAYQRGIIVRRTRFDLKAAKQRALIVGGLLVAIKNIDEVIRIIKASASTPKAKEALRNRFLLNDDQAQAIVDMRLKALTHLEVETLEAELAELEKKIAFFESILGSERKQYQVVRDELCDVKKRLKTGRASVILGAEEASAATSSVPTEQEAVAYREGILLQNAEGTLRLVSQKIFSTGMKNVDTSDVHTAPVCSLAVNNKGTLLAFTDMGNVLKINVNDLPDKKWNDKGTAVNQINPEGKPGEKFVKLFFFESTPVGEFLFFTKGGMVKRTDLNEFASIRPYSSAIILSDKDELISVEIVSDGKNVLEVTAQGQSLVYAPSEIPVQGRKAAGVKGIKLNDNDFVAFGGQIEDEGEVIVSTVRGYAKRVIASTLETASRYLKGVKIIDLDSNEVNFIATVKMPYDVLFAVDNQLVKVNTEQIPLDTRTTKGKRMFKSDVKAVIPLPVDD